jgi:hypothetical protein
MSISTKYFRIFTISFLLVIAIAFLAFALTANAATLSLSPSKSSVPVGEIFNVDILLDTADDDTDGVNIKYLNFDPTLLEVQKVFPGTLYPLTQSNTYDNASGTINFSQITTGGSTYSGSGTLATITFLAKSAGSAVLSFDFEPDNTRNTNVASAGVAVLTDALGGVYKIRGDEGFFSWIINFFLNLFSISS